MGVCVSHKADINRRNLSRVSREGKFVLHLSQLMSRPVSMGSVKRLTLDNNASFMDKHMGSEPVCLESIEDVSFAECT